MAKRINTVTLAQIEALKWSKEMTKGWRGNQDPASYAEFDCWIAELDEAIKAVARDRKRLRKLLSEELSTKN